ncbi:MAG: bifunctional (p)ppGpp synthetase/guanosine-3',5'-bis(diphosphate) 3'-pyrophosphohydrolase [Firmicutes bacterium]|nr:bifunctional (p)ppGpp synthetase/guanosine-3',5'-bis(diphosphate) 3'-pyrophosphohydrolase [Bacillota bacterium]
MSETGIDRLIAKIKEYNPDIDTNLIRRAYEFADKAHEGQKRESGEPYVDHPLEVAMLLAEQEMDQETLIAGLLHDVVEDTDTPLETVEAQFGPNVAMLVNGVTKLGQIPTLSKEERQAENLRKMLLAMAKDLRVIIIKLADRLHNMRTLKALPPERQRKVSKETLEIYSPIAHRLGMWRIKWELEDLALRYLEPKEYYKLVEMVNEKLQERQGFINEAIAKISARLDELGIKYHIEGRPKHFYSIYNKMKKQGKQFDEIFDLIGIRVLVETVKDCYAVLGIVHVLWKPIPGRFKDYIAMPKSNMYQSLHTTVVGENGRSFEVQIRTWEMHRTAEYGVAAHWKYKEGKTGTDVEFEKKVAWLRQLLEWQRETKDIDDFMETLRIDLFEDEVFVFTPKGDVKTLPAGSTPVDFAYSVHTDIGHHTVGAKVNGKIVPLDYKLKNGEFVEILTSKNGRPSRDWLSIVKTSKARSKIRSWLREQNRERMMLKGREILERHAQKYGFDLGEFLKEADLEEVAQKNGYANFDDLLANVGYGKVTANQVLSRLVGEEEWRKKQLELKRQYRQKKLARKSTNRAGIGVKGIDNPLVRTARCCNPVPGDPIIGYITRGRGVSVHRADCPNISELSKDPERQIEVFWKEKREGTYAVELEVEAVDRRQLLSDVIDAVSKAGTGIDAVNARTTKNHLAIINIKVIIADVEHMQKVIEAISKVDGVIHVCRANPT